MSNHQIHAMLIEDDPDDVLLLKDALADIGLGRIKLDYTDRLSRGLIQLSSQPYDVVLLDLNLPDSRGLDTLNTTVRRFPRLPVVILSGLADDMITIEAVRRGAQDYLVKGEISGPLVMRVMRYAIERKQVEGVLRASEARYRTLVETSPNGIILADLEGKMVLCNQQTAELLGYNKPEAVVGSNLFKFISPGDRQLAAHNIRKTLNESKSGSGEYTMIRRDGSQFPAEISTAVQCNSSGSPTGFISITRDVTERKKVQDAEKQLVMLEKEFIANVARGLRKPILHLMAYFKQSHSGRVTNSEMQQETMRQAYGEVGNLLDMVDELLDFSLIESDQLALKWEKVDLGKLITATLGSLRGKANARGVSLISAPMEATLNAEVDPTRMRRALSKLVEHAINFSEKNGTVLVTGKVLNDRVLINVIDEGGGMEVEDCARLFEKYSQINHTVEKNTSAAGMGLYTTKQIVEAHGGSLTVSSQVGSGSTISVSLPMERKNK
jgi:PAS domain S-box-containing protein